MRFALLLVLLIATLMVSACSANILPRSGKDICKQCNNSCARLAYDPAKSKCVSFCAKRCNAVSASVSSDEMPMSDAEFLGKIKDFLKNNKCNVCKMGCNLIRNDRTKQTCITGCEIGACGNGGSREAAPAPVEGGEEEAVPAAVDAEMLAEIETETLSQVQLWGKIKNFFKRNKCSICRGGCNLIRNETGKAACLQGCDRSACTSSSEDFEVEADAEADSDAMFLGFIKDFFKNNKCSVCRGGCNFIRSESGKAMCLQGCVMSRACPAEQPATPAEQPAETMSNAEFLGGLKDFFNSNKCSICRGGCNFIRNESGKAACLQGCVMSRACPSS